MKRTPLYMFPNGTFARTADKVPDGCVLVEEPELPDEPEVKIEDQTQAVLEAERGENDSR
ncbi:MAG: hypothetical protein CMO33_09985 [Verrucomicrobia bacterium]|nr:hypothetical protein [Verrucomicrobiota bacterium]